ncbi:hypothetical protein BDY24DRAFT_403337 [Mrakia frigida]|uniref:uncharacterized protein n=1 Tax=Mrakia frigida TaxID=29902 RepID=UPI003FCC1BE3
MSEDEEEEEEEEEEEQSEEEEDESSTSHDLADGASFTPPSAPPLSPSLDASTTVADLVAEGLLIPKPPLPSIESTSPSSPPSTAPVPTSRPNDLPDSSSTSSDTTSATPPNIQLPSSLPQDGIALSGPRTTPDLDGTFERRGREGRLASIFSLPEDGELGKGSSASSIVDTRSQIGGELRFDRFWESWACLYELD